MSQMADKTGLQIPDRMRAKLERYQRRIWTIKLIEGLCAAAFGLLASYLVVFGLDRFFDTSGWIRALILLVGSVGLAIWFPYVCHRWIWKSRHLAQVARMLKVNHPRLGDYLLGIIELVDRENFDGSSKALCVAALAQADRETADRDFTDAVPTPRHRRWAMVVALPLMIAVVAMLWVPAAGSNALLRWVMPWKSIDRYTFTQVDPLPQSLVVPLAEPTDLSANLSESSRWNPESGSVWIGRHRVESKNEAGRYRFELPPFKAPTRVQLRIGDVLESVEVDPQPRPELAALAATIQLPEYLQRTNPVEREIRGGGLSIVDGSQVSIEATATRPLTSATVDGQAVSIHDRSIRTNAILVSEPRTLELVWRDGLGLTAKSPLKLKLRSAEDESPTLTCRELEPQRVMMEKDVLSFEVDAADDFGVKTIGMEWAGNPPPTSAAQPAAGSKIVFAGNPEATEISAVTATFSPTRENVAPQTIELKLFAEDYLPGRERVYSQPFTVYVLSEEEHAIWMTRRLDDWFKQSLETYEAEQQLYKKNVELRNLSSAELDRPETRRKIESQASAEQAQARRLNALTIAGEQLVREAARNENFGVDHLEKLAEMIQNLKDIHENRMPSVSDLLKKASEAEAASGPTGSASKSVSDNPAIPGQSTPKSESSESDSENPNKTPSVSLKESSMDQPDDQDPTGEEAEPTPPKSGKFTLPGVTLADNSKKEGGGACPAGQQMEQAVESQEALLAEFQKVAEELQKLIANLEGSTFVKRLKAMSRRELVVAKDVGQSTLSGFGARHSQLKNATVERMRMLVDRQKAHGSTLQNIEDDLEAYSNRVQEGKFKTVLAEMREMEAVKQVHAVADRMVANEPGTSIAHTEFLADTFDRWAEQLVGPG